jgi:hypothetical protein
MRTTFTIQHLEQLQGAGKIRGFVTNHVEVKKKSKYGNKKTEVDGIVFDSAKEAKRYSELKVMLKAVEIGMLEMQVPFELKVEGNKVCRYVADFRYIDSRTGELVVEDVKSDFTRKLPTYRLKKKLMKQILGIIIKEV